MNAFVDAAEIYACSDICQLLSAFLRLPDRPLSLAIVKGVIGGDAEAIGLDLASAPEVGAVLGCKSSDLSSDLEENEVLSSLRRDFTRLFVHPDGPLVPIYESQYLRKEDSPYVLPLVVNPTAVDAERFYKRARLVQTEGVNDSCDHMAMELEYLQFEYASWAQAIENGDWVGASAHRNAVLSFDEKHSSKWARDFFQSVEALAQTRVYQGVGSIGKAFFLSYPSCLA